MRMESDERKKSQQIVELGVRLVLAVVATILRRWVFGRRIAERKRRKAARKAFRLARRGKEIPEEIIERAVEGLGRRSRKKFERKLEEALGTKKETKKPGSRYAFALILLAGALVAWRLVRK